ncbi:MAG: hypothetical protein IPJ28_11000 [Betaproteobacteria bacterium]|nr:hypothetical protein [Betaproteobacteria bacterium]
MLGNLGPRVYRLTEGSAFFESPETGPMPFATNVFFGQLETQCNYVSSRILGMLTANKGSQIEVTDNRHVLGYLQRSERFTDKLFLSLLQHLTSVQFKPFVSAKRRATLSV